MSNVSNSHSGVDIYTTLKKCIESDKPDKFLNSINEFIDDNGDPNLRFPKFRMGEHIFRDISLFQVAYLYWKDSERDSNTTLNKHFKNMVTELLNDKRTKLYRKFTEYSLSNREHFLSGNSQTDALSRKVNGYLLEDVTIAHYAIAIGDDKTVAKVLEKDPSLMNSTCSIVKAKNLLHDKKVESVTFCVGNKGKKYEATSKEFSEKVKKYLGKDKGLTGEIAHVVLSKGQNTKEYSITRITDVSLLHLAARVGSVPVCTSLREAHVNFMVRDSKGQNPIDYLELSFSEQVIAKDDDTRGLRRVLNPIKQIGAKLLKEDVLLLKKENYWQLFDTSMKVTACAYEYLTKDSLEKNTSRIKLSFRRDVRVSKKEHGANQDYTNSGYDRGHVVAAENAVFSEEAMKDAFLYTNAFPQDPNLNKGYWKKLETHVRKLVKDHDYCIELFTGCLFDKTYDDEVIGKGEIAIPTHAFKVMHLHKEGKKTKVKAYIVPNKAIQTGTSLDTFLSTVEKVQKLSGIRFDKWE